MTLFNIVLFVHLLTVAGAFFAVGGMTACMARFAACRQVCDASAALKATANIGKMMPIVTLLLLVTGGIMTQSRWTWTTGWIDVGIATLLVVTAIGGGLIGARERVLHHRLAELSRDAAPDEVTALARERAIPMFTGLNVGLVSGVMFVMVAKGSFLGSLAAVIVAGALGFAVAALIARPRSANEGVELVEAATERV